MQEDADLIDRDDQQKFLASADFLANYGLPKLISNMQTAATEVLKAWVFFQFFILFSWFIVLGISIFYRLAKNYMSWSNKLESDWICKYFPENIAIKWVKWRNNLYSRPELVLGLGHDWGEHFSMCPSSIRSDLSIWSSGLWINPLTWLLLIKKEYVVM